MYKYVVEGKQEAVKKPRIDEKKKYPRWFYE
jgi:hypothetical protein